MTFQINKEKNYANIMIFWVINKGSNVWNQVVNLVVLLGDLQVTPLKYGSCSLRAALRVTLPVHALILPHFNKVGITSKEYVYKYL